MICKYCGEEVESGLFNWMEHNDVCKKDIPQPKEKYEMPPFAVNQRVVCIKAHSQGILEVGKEYVVLWIMQCDCGKWQIDVGVISRSECSGYSRFTCFNTRILTPIWWVTDDLFAPIKYTRITFEKVMELVETSVN